MIELHHDRLVFSFPEVHPDASLTITFQRTLRVPDDGFNYALPPGLGVFPIRHVDDFASRVPQKWVEHGGVMMPMYQSEAMWLNFAPSYIKSQGNYPFAVRVLTGKIDAVTGESYAAGLRRNPQNYVVSPGQPWLDGYCAGKGVVRQFVAMPLGEGYTAEEQITGEGEHGGVQLVVYPMKRVAFDRLFCERTHLMAQRVRGKSSFVCQETEMGIAPGGMIKQQLYMDRFDLDDWDKASSRCFVHIVNSQVWRQITLTPPPMKPPTAKQYTKAGLPWFDYYDDQLGELDGTEPLERLLSVNTLKRLWTGKPLDGNKSCDPKVVIPIRNGLKKHQVRESEL